MMNIKYFKKFNEVLSYNTGILELSLLKNGMPKQHHLFCQTNLSIVSWLFPNNFKTSIELLEIKESYNLDLNRNHKNKVIHAFTLDDIKNVQKLLPKNSFERVTLYLMQSYLEKMLREADKEVELPTGERNLYALSLKQRWFLYFCWMRYTKEMFDLKLIKQEQEYAQILKQYSELKALENVKLLKTMHVIALTTTGAAKHRIMLEGLESPIGMK